KGRQPTLRKWWQHPANARRRRRLTEDGGYGRVPLANGAAIAPSFASWRDARGPRRPRATSRRCRGRRFRPPALAALVTRPPQDLDRRARLDGRAVRSLVGPRK